MLLAGCRRPDAPVVHEPSAVVAEVVQSAPFPPVVRRGVIATGSRLKLGFNAAGVIAQVKVKAGDRVHKGAVLARLQSGTAAAALRAAEANRARAVRDQETTARLAETGTIGTTQRDDAKTALDVASANAAIAAVALSDRRIVSPIDGTVLERLADPGESVAPGSPVLVVDDTEHLLVRVGVTESELARIRAGDDATLLLDGLDASAPAVVTSVGAAPRADGLYAVEVSPRSDSGHSFRAGATLSVRFDGSSDARVVRAPLDAIVYRDDKTWVFVVTAAGDATRVRMREVKLDRAEDTQVVVRDGLSDGDRIVREGACFLDDEQLVKVVPGGA